MKYTGLAHYVYSGHITTLKQAFLLQNKNKHYSCKLRWRNEILKALLSSSSNYLKN